MCANRFNIEIRNHSKFKFGLISKLFSIWKVFAKLEWFFYIQNQPWAAFLFFSESAQSAFFLFCYPRNPISLSRNALALPDHSPLLFFSSYMAQMPHTSGPAQPSCFYQSPTSCARPG
jgi:hypothetical protein